jgi:nucleotidyltransferase substrate binding protein (TIGR01987 family)
MLENPIQENIEDVRWQQRFRNYLQALNNLQLIVVAEQTRKLNEFEQAGKVQYFEILYELSWKLLKDYLEYQGGEINIIGSKDAIQLAFNRGLIDNGMLWMEMLKSRNKTSHIYDEATVNQIVADISQKYYPEFLKLAKLFNKFLSNTNNTI